MRVKTPSDVVNINFFLFVLYTSSVYNYYMPSGRGRSASSFQTQGRYEPKEDRTTRNRNSYQDRSPNNRIGKRISLMAKAGLGGKGLGKYASKHNQARANPYRGKLRPVGRQTSIGDSYKNRDGSYTAKTGGISKSRTGGKTQSRSTQSRGGGTQSKSQSRKTYSEVNSVIPKVDLPNLDDITNGDGERQRRQMDYDDYYGTSYARQNKLKDKYSKKLKKKKGVVSQNISSGNSVLDSYRSLGKRLAT